jgi:hypothetical protein
MNSPAARGRTRFSFQKVALIAGGGMALIFVVLVLLNIYSPVPGAEANSAIENNSASDSGAVGTPVAQRTPHHSVAPEPAQEEKEEPAANHHEARAEHHEHRGRGDSHGQRAHREGRHESAHHSTHHKVENADTGDRAVHGPHRPEHEHRHGRDVQVAETSRHGHHRPASKEENAGKQPHHRHHHDEVAETVAPSHRVVPATICSAKVDAFVADHRATMLDLRGCLSATNASAGRTILGGLLQEAEPQLRHRLQQLDLGDNHIAAGAQLPLLVVTPGALPHMAILFLSGNKFTELPRELHGLVNLTRLSLKGNALTGMVDVRGRVPPSLVQLILTQNGITGIKGLGSLARMRKLMLAGNALSSVKDVVGPACDDAGRCTTMRSLELLRLSRNKIDVVTPEDVDMLRALPRLSWFSLSGNSAAATSDIDAAALRLDGNVNCTAAAVVGQGTSGVVHRCVWTITATAVQRFVAEHGMTTLHASAAAVAAVFGSEKAATFDGVRYALPVAVKFFRKVSSDGTGDDERRTLAMLPQSTHLTKPLGFVDPQTTGIAITAASGVSDTMLAAVFLFLKGGRALGGMPTIRSCVRDVFDKQEDVINDSLDASLTTVPPAPSADANRTLPPWAHRRWRNAYSPWIRGLVNTLDIAYYVVDGLEKLHAARVVHGDVYLHNVFHASILSGSAVLPAELKGDERRAKGKAFVQIISRFLDVVRGRKERTTGVNSSDDGNSTAADAVTTDQPAADQTEVPNKPQTPERQAATETPNEHHEENVAATRVPQRALLQREGEESRPRHHHRAEGSPGHHKHHADDTPSRHRSDDHGEKDASPRSEHHRSGGHTAHRRKQDAGDGEPARRHREAADGAAPRHRSSGQERPEHKHDRHGGARHEHHRRDEDDAAGHHRRGEQHERHHSGETQRDHHDARSHRRATSDATPTAAGGTHRVTAVLSDFGASFRVANDAVTARHTAKRKSDANDALAAVLEAFEVRAFGVMLRDLLTHDGHGNAEDYFPAAASRHHRGGGAKVTAALLHAVRGLRHDMVLLAERCLIDDATQRPTFAGLSVNIYAIMKRVARL